MRITHVLCIIALIAQTVFSTVTTYPSDTFFATMGFSPYKPDFTNADYNNGAPSYSYTDPGTGNMVTISDGSGYHVYGAPGCDGGSLQSYGMPSPQEYFVLTFSPPTSAFGFHFFVSNYDGTCGTFAPISAVNVYVDGNHLPYTPSVSTTDGTTMYYGVSSDVPMTVVQIKTGLNDAPQSVYTDGDLMLSDFSFSGSASSPTNTGTGGSDPVITGFNGEVYDFTGIANRVFNMFSIADLQVNALFIAGEQPGKTYMGAIGIKQGGVTNIIFDLDSAVLHVIDQTTHNELARKKLHFPMAVFELPFGGLVNRSKSSRLEVSWPHYSVSMIRRFEKHNSTVVQYIDIAVTVNIADLKRSDVHGVIGQTYHRNVSAAGFEGMWQDYAAPAGDLDVFTDRFPSNSFYKYSHKTTDYTKGSEKIMQVTHPASKGEEA